MGVGAFIEPLVVVGLLFGGTWVNRDTQYQLFGSSPRRPSRLARDGSPDSIESGLESPRSADGLLSPRSPSPFSESSWRKRELRFLGFTRTVTSPNTGVFRDRFLSRLLRKLPFLVEVWYWALIYWVRWTSVRSHDHFGVAMPPFPPSLSLVGRAGMQSTVLQVFGLSGGRLCSSEIVHTATITSYRRRQPSGSNPFLTHI